MQTATTYTSGDGQITISVRWRGARQIYWALHVGGGYKGSKVLPSDNAAVVQNFGFDAADFSQSKSSIPRVNPYSMPKNASSKFIHRNRAPAHN